MIEEKTAITADTHVTEERLHQFVRLSEVLLDYKNLPIEAARAFLRIVLEVTPKYYAPGDRYEGPDRPSDPHPFDVLWEAFCQLEQESPDDLESRLTAAAAADVTLGTLVRNIIIVWYNGYLGDRLPPAEIYPSALVWQVIRANPPGVPGPYYGHWAYPPPDLILPPSGEDHKDRRPHYDRKKRR